jgi:hypothetical protein
MISSDGNRKLNGLESIACRVESAVEEKILPYKETIRRFYERAAALYEPSHTGKNISRRYHKTYCNCDWF